MAEINPIACKLSARTMQSNILISVVVILCYIDLAWAFSGPSSAASRYQTMHQNNNKASSKINLPRHRHNSILYAIDNDIDIISNTNIQTNNSNSLADELSTSTDDDTITKVGSSEYYQGFWSRSVIENQERVTGDAVLGPTLKLAGGISLILVGLIGVFLVSNGII